MSSTIMSSLSHVATESVGAALRELGLAAHRFVLTLWSAALRRSRRAPQAPSRVEAASKVRRMALRYERTDPGYAADLFAAADRHERAGGA